MTNCSNYKEGRSDLVWYKRETYTFCKTYHQQTKQWKQKRH